MDDQESLSVVNNAQTKPVGVSMDVNKRASSTGTIKPAVAQKHGLMLFCSLVLYVKHLLKLVGDANLRQIAGQASLPFQGGQHGRLSHTCCRKQI